jgi:Glycosyl-hydrolase 97 N-terminal
MLPAPRRGSPTLLFIALVAAIAPNARGQYAVKSPDGRLGIAVRHGRDGITFTVTSGRTVLVDRGALGLTTNRGDLASGLRFTGQSRAVVKETYRL